LLLIRLSSSYTSILTGQDLTNLFKLCRRQFLINSAFTMTISKVQGQTLKRDGICPPSPGFSHAHLYVALSRSS
jgi:hypothetical protein